MRCTHSNLRSRRWAGSEAIPVQFGKFSSGLQRDNLALGNGCPPGGYDPSARLAVMDDEQIEMVLLYPTIGIAWEGIVRDPMIATAYCRAYNRWLVDFCSRDRRRLGDDDVVWASDYPHLDASFNVVGEIRKKISQLPEVSQRKVLGENALRFYGLSS